MDPLSLSAAELSWLLDSAGPVNPDAAKALGLTAADLTTAVQSAGFSSLTLRGLVRSDGTVADVAPAVAAVAHGIADATVVVEVGLASGDTADGAIIFSSDDLRLLVAPRGFGCYDVLGLDADEDLAAPLAALAVAFLPEHAPAIAAFVLHGEGKPQTFTLTQGEDWAFVAANGEASNHLSEHEAVSRLHADLATGVLASHVNAKRYDPGQLRDPHTGEWSDGTPNLSTLLPHVGDYDEFSLDEVPDLHLEVHRAFDGEHGGLRSAISDSASKIYRDEHDRVVVRAEGVITNQSGKVVGSFRRNLFPATGELHNDTFALAANEQGAGFAQKFAERSEAVLASQGFRRATVSATGVGGYAWAKRYGWDPSKPHAAGDVPSRLADIGNRYPLTDSDAARIQAWLQGFRQPDQAYWPTPAQVAAFGRNRYFRVSGDHTLWPGKDVMIGSSWSGVRDLARPGKSAKRFDPGQERDPDGKWGDGIPGPSASGLKDTLNLAGRINLADDETLVGSAKVDGDQAGVRMALTERGGARMLRFGAGGENYGKRNSEEGMAAWDGNPSPAPLTRVERGRLNAERDALRDEGDAGDLTPERQAEVDARLDEVHARLTADDIGFNGTAQLDVYSMTRLASKIRAALAEAVEQEKAENKAWDELQELEGANNPDPGRLAELREITGRTNYITFDQGIIPGSAWGDVHYSVELDDPTMGPEVHLGVQPKGAPDDWGDGRDWQGRFDPAETRKILKLLDKFGDAAATKSRRGRSERKFDEHQPRDTEGQWSAGAAGSLNLSGLIDSVEVEGTFGDLAMGVDEAGDIRMTFHEGAEVRELDLSTEDVAGLGDALEQLSSTRDDLDGSEGAGVYDEVWFGEEQTHRADLYANGLVSVVFGAEDPDPWELNLDPPEGGNDDVQSLIGAIDSVLATVAQLDDEDGAVA